MIRALFDSGIGGFTVLIPLLERSAGEFLYFGDFKYVPYGNRDVEWVKRRALRITEFLKEKGAEEVLMACNISSSVALPEARIRWGRVWGLVEPLVERAVRLGLREVGVIATVGTVKSGVYREKLENAGIKVVEAPCPEFVNYVERGEWDSDELKSLAREYMREIISRKVKHVVLGCTHYPFLKEALFDVYPVNYLDPGEILAEKVAGEERAVDGDRRVTFYFSAPSGIALPIFEGEMKKRGMRASWNVEVVDV